MLLAWHAGGRVPGATPVFRGVAGEVEGRLHERNMAERLWHVADQPGVARIVLLTQQAYVVTQGEQPLEQLHRLLMPAAQLERVRQPETAGEEGPLGACQPVHR